MRCFLTQIKKPHLSPVILIVLIASVIVLTVQRYFVDSGVGGERSLPYSNLWVRYTWHERGLRSAKVDSFIATPEFPVDQTYNGTQGSWTYRFNNGNEFNFIADGNHLVWVDPLNGPQTVPTQLTKAMVDVTRTTSAQVKRQRFDSPHAFLTHLTTAEAEQNSSSN